MNKEYNVGDIVVVRYDKEYTIGVISRIEYDLNNKCSQQKKKYLIYFKKISKFILLEKRQIKYKIDPIEIQDMVSIGNRFKFIEDRIEKGGGRFGI